MPVFFSRTAAAAQDVRYAVTNTNRVLLLVVAFAVEAKFLGVLGAFAAKVQPGIRREAAKSAKNSLGTVS